MKIKYLIMILVALLIICSLPSCKLFGKKALIGRISEDGNKYIAYNDIFAINSTKYNKTNDIFGDMMVADELNENGYRVVYQGVGHIIDEVFIFRDLTDYDQLKVLAQARVDSIGDWSEITYTNVTQTEDFILYFIKYIIVGESPYTKRDKEYKSSLNVLFCYNDSIQFVISKYLYSDHSFGDEEAKERKGRSAEKRLKFKLNNNLELNEKLFTEGVPEPLTEEELKALRKRKPENTKFRKRELGFIPPRIN